MKPNRRSHVRLWCLGTWCLVSVAAAAAQDPKPGPQEEPANPAEAPPVREAGGRLVVHGRDGLVTGDPDLPPRDSSVATKVDTPLLETPRSVSVVDGRMLDELGAISLTQAHDYAVGITPLDERGPAAARGFPVEFYDLRRDGLRTYSWCVREPVAIDRIQYLRGPAAVLYGDGSPGALVNMVLKKPLPVARYEIGVSGGSLGFGRVTADLTGPLSAGRGVPYRVVGALETLEDGYDNGERRLTLLPTIGVDLGARGTLTGEANSTASEVSPSLGLLALPQRWVSLYASYAQGFEPPTFGQYLEDGPRSRRPSTRPSRVGSRPSWSTGGSTSPQRLSESVGRTCRRPTRADSSGRSVKPRARAWSSTSSAAWRSVGECAPAMPGPAPRSRATRAGSPARSPECPPAPGGAVDALRPSAGPAEGAEGRGRRDPRLRPLHGS